MSSTNIKNPDVHYRESQKVYYAGTPVYSDGTNLIFNETTLSGINNGIDDLSAEITSVSGALQGQIDSLYISLASYVEEAGNHTLASGVSTTFITFSGTQEDTNYISSAIVRGGTNYIGAMITVPTLSGVNIKLSTTTDSADYSVDWSIIRTT